MPRHGCWWPCWPSIEALIGVSSGIRTCSLKATSADTCGGGNAILSPGLWLSCETLTFSRSVADTDRRGYP